MALAGLPVPADPGDVVMLDAELSIVTASASADKLIRVDRVDGGPYLAVVEFQSSHDPRLDDRVLLYNALARWRYNLPVRNVVYLLRREAAGRGVTGRVVGPGLTFVYEEVRVWQLSPGRLLAGAIGTVPPAPLADMTPAELQSCIDLVRYRLTTDVPTEKTRDLLAQTAVLLGLRYDTVIAERLMQSVTDLEESSVYQAIIKKGIDQGWGLGREEGRDQGLAQGREEGRRQGARDLLLRLTVQKFGPPDAPVVARLNVADLAELNRLTDRVLSADDWDDLLADQSDTRSG